MMARMHARIEPSLLQVEANRSHIGRAHAKSGAGQPLLLEPADRITVELWGIPRASSFGDEEGRSMSVSASAPRSMKHLLVEFSNAIERDAATTARGDGDATTSV